MKSIEKLLMFPTFFLQLLLLIKATNHTQNKSNSHRQGIQDKGAGHSGLDHKQEPFIICVNKTWQQKLQKD